jgi:hypothetical protein
VSAVIEKNRTNVHIERRHRVSGNKRRLRMPMIILTQERGDPVLINSDWIVHATRVSSSPHDVTNITMGDTTLTVLETLEQIRDVIQKGS